MKWFSAFELSNIFDILKPNKSLKVNILLWLRFAALLVHLSHMEYLKWIYSTTQILECSDLPVE